MSDKWMSTGDAPPHTCVAGTDGRYCWCGRDLKPASVTPPWVTVYLNGFVIYSGPDRRSQDGAR
jgi:hypothetical protein